MSSEVDRISCAVQEQVKVQQFQFIKEKEIDVESAEEEARNIGYNAEEMDAQSSTTINLNGTINIVG